MPPLLPAARWALTPPFHPYSVQRKAMSQSGLFSVALSVGLPRPGVTRHRIFLESGLSSTVLPRSSSLPRTAGLSARRGDASIDFRPPAGILTHLEAGIEGGLEHQNGEIRTVQRAIGKRAVTQTHRLKERLIIHVHGIPRALCKAAKAGGVTPGR